MKSPTERVNKMIVKLNKMRELAKVLYPSEIMQASEMAKKLRWW